jgi:hypothetical protein
MASIDYCILTMKIMEIYHKCSLDKIPKYGNGKAFGLFPTIYQEYNKQTRGSQEPVSFTWL